MGRRRTAPPGLPLALSDHGVPTGSGFTFTTLLAQTRELSRSATHDLRVSLSTLRPESAGERGTELPEQVRAGDLRAEGLELSTNVADVALSPQQTHALDRVLREAARYILCHAGARHVRLALGRASGTLTLTVADDGRVFDPAGVLAGYSGLRDMTERLARLDGMLHIRSAPGEGAVATARLPLGASLPTRDLPEARAALPTFLQPQDVTP